MHLNLLWGAYLITFDTLWTMVSNFTFSKSSIYSMVWWCCYFINFHFEEWPNHYFLRLYVEYILDYSMFVRKVTGLGVLRELWDQEVLVDCVVI